MTLLIAVAVLVWVGVMWEHILVPWWERRAERAAERRAECERAGHRWGTIFHAYEDPRLPVRNCDGCGLQEHLTRCPMCRKPVSPTTGKPVDAE